MKLCKILRKPCRSESYQITDLQCFLKILQSYQITDLQGFLKILQSYQITDLQRFLKMLQSYQITDLQGFLKILQSFIKLPISISSTLCKILRKPCRSVI
jgi:hypothetical protein